MTNIITTKPNVNTPTEEIIEIIDRLYKYQGHFTLCQTSEPKKAFKHDYLKRRASRKALHKHVQRGRPIGLVPWSLQCVVIDCDYGDPSELVELFPPLVIYPTRTDGHYHLWYAAREDLSKYYQWNYQGLCSGQILSSTRHAALPNYDALRVLWDGMRNSPSHGSFHPPMELITPSHTPPIPPSHTPHEDTPPIPPHTPPILVTVT